MSTSHRVQHYAGEGILLTRSQLAEHRAGCTACGLGGHCDYARDLSTRISELEHLYDGAVVEQMLADNRRACAHVAEFAPVVAGVPWIYEQRA